MDRRNYLKATAGATAALAFAGCLGGTEGGEGTDAGTDGTDAKKDVITIGSDIPYPPFEYMEDGEAKGFDPAIAQAVFTDELGYDFEFKDTAFDGIIPALKNGNFRVIMSAMTITEKRKKQVAFSDPYFTAYQTIAVPKNSDIDSKEALKGTTVGVQKGTTGSDAADQLKEEFGGDLTIKRFDTISDAFNAMINNQVDAVINDNTVSAEYVNKNKDKVKFVEGEGVAAEEGREDAPPYLTLTIEDYGIAFRQDDTELLEEVNTALKAIKDSGTYDEIYNEYFEG